MSGVSALELACIGLGLLFIGLKLGNVIAWSWWWVLAPFWGPVAFALIILLALGGIILGVWLFKIAFGGRRW